MSDLILTEKNRQNLEKLRVHDFGGDVDGQALAILCGSSAFKSFGIDTYEEDWYFLFSSAWLHPSGSRIKIDRRIELYLEKGLPSEWSYRDPESEWVWL